MHPKYCVDCSEIHADRCPKRSGKAYYTNYGGWNTDLKQSDLPKTGGYPKEVGHIIQRERSQHAESFDSGEPNCKIHAASLIITSHTTKGGGGAQGSIARETAVIRSSDLRRLDAIYDFIKHPNKLTGIPTIDPASSISAKQQKRS